MKWVRVSQGLWFVWPPRQFTTLEADGLNVWRNGFRWTHYVPDRQSGSAPTAPEPRSCSSDSNVIGWFAENPADWGAYPDGRHGVALRDFIIALAQSKIHFRQVHSFPGRDLGYFHAVYIENPPTEPASSWSSCNLGLLSPPDAKQRLWHYPIPDGRRWVGTFEMEPDRLVFHRSTELPPPILPTDEDVEAEQRQIDQQRETRGDLWPLSQMQRDLGKSSELMELVLRDDFAAEFHLLVRDDVSTHLKSGKLVNFNTDDEAALILSELRRYREYFGECQSLPWRNDATARKTLVQLFAEVGYA